MEDDTFLCVGGIYCYEFEGYLKIFTLEHSYGKKRRSRVLLKLIDIYDNGKKRFPYAGIIYKYSDHQGIKKIT